MVMTMIVRNSNDGDDDKGDEKDDGDDDNKE